MRYNGATGAFIGAFVTAGSGGLSQPECVTFGPDSNLYVGNVENVESEVEAPTLSKWGLTLVVLLFLTAIYRRITPRSTAIPL